MPTVIPPNLPVDVVVFAGDVSKFTQPPEIQSAANSADNPTLEGITVAHSEGSIPYGLSRVLWQQGDWVEATTDLPFTAIGIQFHGDHVIGWVRVLFDGLEVWPGDTSKIWSHLGRSAGYIEVSGFDPGTHTIRVEYLAVDGHPVIVRSFGFNYHAGVAIR